jgi:hypothetical protein
MADGGEVYSGSLATQALRAVDARAMTVDHTIFVDESFDEDNPEDQALYAHETHHLQESGGVGEHGGGHDAEELAARSIERMVLHRRASGEDFGSVMRDVRQGRVDEGAPQTAGTAPEDATEDEDDPMAAYRALRRRGWSHADIVDMLAKNVVAALNEADEQHQARAASSSRIV